MRVTAIEGYGRMKIRGSSPRHGEHLFRRVHARHNRSFERKGDRGPARARADVEDRSPVKGRQKRRDDVLLRLREQPPNRPAEA